MNHSGQSPARPTPHTTATSDAATATPEAALARLLAGNRRFVTNTRVHPHQDAERRAALATVQRPFAVVFGCSDSRLAAEIIFDCGLGDLFVVRTAGHIIGPEVLASIDYGVSVLGAPLVVVLGHDSCGAIKATYDALTEGIRPSEDLRTIIERVAPSIEHARAHHISDDGAMADIHVRRTIDMIAHHDTTVSDAISAGRCALVGMSYRLAEGKVTVVTTVPTIHAP